MELISAFFGALVGKVFEDRVSKRDHAKNVAFCVITILTFIVGIIGIFIPNNLIADYFPFNILHSLEGNRCLASLILVILYIAVVGVYKHSRTGLSFDKYSKIIQDFTNRAGDNSVITIVAGDMDFLGQVKYKEVNPNHSMDINAEYNQLSKLLEDKSGVRLRILCSHCLYDDKRTRNSILNSTLPQGVLIKRYSNSRSPAKHRALNQLLRIGQISASFGSSVEFGFYETLKDDIGLRARFVDDRGIVYKKVGKHRTTKMAIKKLLHKICRQFPCVSSSATDYRPEDLYSINELSEEDSGYFLNLINLMWDKRNPSNDKTIVKYCERLYGLTNEGPKHYRLALVYAKSYEIARKGSRRKEFPPFGVMYLASAVGEVPGWEVDLLGVDENTPAENLDIWQNYDMIGFSIISSYSYFILKRCCNLTKIPEDILKFAGGYQAEKFSNNVFQDFDVDVIIRGEGEEVIKSLCDSILSRDFGSIDHILYKDNKGAIQASDEFRALVDINMINPPAREKLSQDDIVMTNRLANTDLRMVHMLFSRGCVHNCAYCAANQDGYVNSIRYRDKRGIVQELKDLKEAYGIEGFSIIDDCFLTDKKKAIDICNYITKEDLDLKWSLAARVDDISSQILEALKSAGCIEIKFGVETGSDYLLKKMNKGTTVDQAT